VTETLIAAIVFTAGASLLSRLSRDPRHLDVKGVSSDVLERMRLLYLRYLQFRMHISATPSRKSEAPEPTPLSGERVVQAPNLSSIQTDENKQ